MPSFKPFEDMIKLLSDNWLSSNTDGITPKFGRTTDFKKLNFKAHRTYVLIGRFKPRNDRAGIGVGNKHVYHEIKIEIRTGGRNYENHWLNCIEEVDRILEANNILDTTVYSYDLIRNDKPAVGESQDLSDEYQNIYRLVKPAMLIKLNVQRGV